MCALGGITFPFRYLFGVGNSLIPEATVAVAGLLGLVVCGILSAAARNKPAVAETGWIIAGKITLLSAPVGYIHSLFGLGQMVVNAASFHEDFLFSFATLATVFVGYALGARGISMEQALQNTEKKLSGAGKMSPFNKYLLHPCFIPRLGRWGGGRKRKGMKLNKM